MIYRYRVILLAVIILLGFVLRFSGALATPYNFDERINMEAAREISLDLSNPKLILVDKRPEGILSERYLFKAGWGLFGESVIGARLPSIIVSLFIILVIYLTLINSLGVNAALISSFVFAVSPYMVSHTRTVTVNSPLILLSVLSLFLFYKGITEKKEMLLLLNGFVIGFGFWFKENMVFLIPIYIIFLAVSEEYKVWLRKKAFWFSFLWALLVLSPIMFSNLHPESQRLKYIYNETAIAVSLNSLGLYFGDLMLIVIKFFPQLFNRIAVSVDPGYPPGETAVLGLLIFFALFYYRKSKVPMIRLLGTCFLFNFILFCFLRRNDMVQGLFSLGSFEWGIIGFTPGIMLASTMLVDFMKRRPFLGRVSFLLLSAFLMLKTVDIITYPLDCYFPLRDFCIENRYLNWEIRDCFSRNDPDSAKDLLRRVFEVTDKNPFYKKKAALKLAQILLQEKKAEEARKYIGYVLFVEPENKEALALLDKIKKSVCYSKGLAGK